MSGRNPVIPADVTTHSTTLTARAEPLHAIENAGALVLPYAVCLYAIIRSVKAFGTYGHDDHMYIPAASLFPHLALYQEIPFVQTPLSVFVYALLNVLVGPAALYFAAKLVSVLLVLGATAISAKTAYRIFPRPYVPWTVATLILLNAHIFSNMAEAANYALPLFLFSIAGYLHVAKSEKPIWGALTGLLMGLAASGKISFAALAGAFALLFLMDRRWRPLTVHYLIGCAIGFLPCAYYLAIDPKDFLFLNIDFHLLTNQFRGLTFLGSMESVLYGSFHFVEFAMPLLALIAMAFVLSRKDCREFDLPALPLSARQKTNAAKAVIIFVAAVIAAVMPMIYFMQYWSTPALVLIVLSVPASAMVADRSSAFRTTMMMGTLALIGLFSVHDLRALGRQGVDNFPPVLVMRTQESVSRILRNSLGRHPGCVTEILSASAIPVLGSGVPLSSGSAAGEFLFRIDGVLKAKRPEFRKYSDVDRYLGPTTGLLTGYYGNREFEQRMVAYAISHGFVLAGTFKYPKAPLTLYLPPECGA